MRQVYFAECSGRIKIGISKNVIARLSELGQGAGGPIKFIASVTGDFPLERALHKKLRPYRIDREWYVDCPEVRAAIQNCLNNFPAPVPGEVSKRTAGKFKAVCKVIWPEHTAERLAEIAGTDARTGTRWLSGHSQPPAIVIAAIMVEITKRS